VNMAGHVEAPLQRLEIDAKLGCQIAGARGIGRSEAQDATLRLHDAVADLERPRWNLRSILINHCHTAATFL
jgi:hypothetical protein